MFSASGTTATAGTGSASRAAAITAAATAAPPAMSDRIQEISAGSRFRFSPPESKVIPLPANAHCRPPGPAWVTSTRRGEFRLPWPTPTTPPNPSRASSPAVQIRAAAPCSTARAAIVSASISGVATPAGVCTRSRTQPAI